MKSKVWGFNLLNRGEHAYFQFSEMKLYDNSDVLVDTSDVKVWASRWYTDGIGGNSGNRSTAALFDGDVNTWLAMPTKDLGGNLLLMTFPTEVEIGRFEITNRSGVGTAGTIEVYKSIAHDFEIYDDIQAFQDNLEFVKAFTINVNLVQETFSYNLSDPEPEGWFFEDPHFLMVPSDGYGREVLPTIPLILSEQVFKKPYFGDGQISGKVTGEDEAPIENATLLLVDPVRKDIIAETTSDILGEYTFSNLTRDGTLFDVIADEGSGGFEKMVSSRRLPINSEPHALEGEARKAAKTYVAHMPGSWRHQMGARKTKGTSGLAILNHPDPFFDKTILLLNTDATTIWDASKDNKPFTSVGLATTNSNPSPAGAYSVQIPGTGYGYFDGFEDFHDRDFTLEYYIRVAGSTTAFPKFITLGEPAASTTDVSTFYCAFDNSVQLHYGEITNIGGYKYPFNHVGNTLSYSTWYHFAWVREGKTFSLYRDGVLHGSQSYTDYPFDLRSNTKTIYISRSTDNITAQIAGLRLTTAARYNTTFTPPTSSELYG